MLISPPSKFEAVTYYIDLPSRSALVARNGTIPWEKPTDRWDTVPERNLIKELHPVGASATMQSRRSGKTTLLSKFTPF